MTPCVLHAGYTMPNGYGQVRREGKAWTPGLSITLSRERRIYELACNGHRDDYPVSC